MSSGDSYAPRARSSVSACQSAAPSSTAAARSLANRSIGITRRAGEFAISKPVREALYTVVPREERYKAKSFIDTVVYRGGDAFSGWLFGLLRGAGMSLSGLAWAALPVAAVWLAVSFWLGRKQAQMHGRG